MTRMNAPKVSYCFNCKKWYDVPNESNDIHPCPECGEVSKMVKCTRCGYEWVVHRPRYPMTCSNCKSPYWNYKRTQTRKQEDSAKKYEESVKIKE